MIRRKVRTWGVSRRRLLQLLMAAGVGAATTLAPHPLQRQQQAANAQPGSKANDGIRDDKLPRILIVEDYPRIAHILGKGLGKYGFATVIAKDGEEALQKVQNEHFDLVCLSMYLFACVNHKSMGSWIVVRELRLQGIQIPIIAYGKFSNYDHEMSTKRGYEIDYYVARPFKVKDLIVQVQKKVGYVQPSQALQ